LLACALALAIATPAIGSDVYLSLDRNPVEVSKDAIEMAEQSLEAVLYKFDDKGLEKAVKKALESGIRVRVVADAEEAKKAHSYIKEIRKAGAEIRLWERGKLHAKFVVLDGKRVLTGSFNWTDSAQHRNTELVIDLDQPATVKRFQEIFERLWQEAKEY